jgi:hypothetical protein
MIARSAYLSQHSDVFRSLTGLRLAEFEALAADLLPRFAAAEHQRLDRPNRQRAIGGGRAFGLCPRDQLLCTIVWLRQYPTYPVLAYLFGSDDATVRRYVVRWLPLLEAAGQDTMRLPDAGRQRGKPLDALLADLPAVAVLIDTCEQRIQRPKDRTVADRYYSGKKKQHTLKSQVAVDETGEVVDVAESVPGPTADITLLDESKLLDRLPDDVGGLGDLAYVGIDKRQQHSAAPRRKPRGKERPAEDIEYNRAFARRRIPVEHTIWQLRQFQALSQMDRHHQNHHTARVRAVAGLVNRRRRQRAAA